MLVVTSPPHLAAEAHACSFVGPAMRRLQALTKEISSELSRTTVGSDIFCGPVDKFTKSCTKIGAPDGVLQILDGQLSLVVWQILACQTTTSS